MRYFISAVALLWALLPNAATAQTIDYELKHPHRVFDGKPMLAQGMEAMNVRWEAGQGSAAFLRHAFQVRQAAGGAVFNFRGTHWDPAAEGYAREYTAPADGIFRSPAVMRLQHGPSGACTWEVNGSVLVARVSCEQEVSVEMDLNTSGADTKSRPTEVRVIAADGARLIAAGTFHPKNFVVVGFGDSYSSGEGNPDLPATWKDVEESFDHAEVHKQLARPAQWWDRSCHRSLYSWQALVAARLVTDLRNKHAVTFLSFACSGALVDDGLLHAQDSPPGGAPYRNVRDGGGASPSMPADYAPSQPMLGQAQVNAALRALCQSQVYGHRRYRLGNGMVMDAPRCRSLLRPDAVLLTIGGNDVRFAGVIANLFVPGTGRTVLGQHLFLPLFRGLVGTVDPEEATAMARDELPGRLLAASAALRQTGFAGDANVFVARYIPPFAPTVPNDWTAARAQCVGQPTYAGQCRVHFNHMAFTTYVGTQAVRGLVGEVTANEARSLEGLPLQIDKALDLLCGATWNCSSAVFPDGQRVPHFGGLNAYAYPDGKDRAYREPTFLHDGSHKRACTDPVGCWHLKRKITSWDTYSDPTANGRFVRTFNDSLFTQAVQTSRGSFGIESLVGVMHPTAMGHAYMADGVYPGFRSHVCALAHGTPLEMCEGQ